MVGARQAYPVRLRRIKIEEVEDRRVAVVFDITAVESDPALFQATGELARQERISDRGASTAAQLARQRQTFAAGDSPIPRDRDFVIAH